MRHDPGSEHGKCNADVYRPKRELRDEPESNASRLWKLADASATPANLMHEWVETYGLLRHAGGIGTCSDGLRA
jgi:hypothetical protein